MSNPAPVSPLSVFMKSLGRVAATAVDGVAASRAQAPAAKGAKPGCTPCAAKAAVLAARQKSLAASANSGFKRRT